MKVLIAIDDSRFSETIVKAVLARPWPANTELKVLHVVEPPSLLMGREMAGPDPEFEAVWNAVRGNAKELVAKITEKLQASGLNVTPALVEGDPKSQIIDTANDWHADLIVVGSHGRTGLNRFLMGSVSDAVVRHAHCSVEVVRTHP